MAIERYRDIGRTWKQLEYGWVIVHTFFGYKVKAQRRGRTLNGSGCKRTKATVEMGGTNSRDEEQNTGSLGCVMGVGRNEW